MSSRWAGCQKPGDRSPRASRWAARSSSVSPLPGLRLRLGGRPQRPGGRRPPLPGRGGVPLQLGVDLRVAGRADGDQRRAAAPSAASASTARPAHGPVPSSSPRSTATCSSRAGRGGERARPRRAGGRCPARRLRSAPAASVGQLRPAGRRPAPGRRSGRSALRSWPSSDWTTPISVSRVDAGAAPAARSRGRPARRRGSCPRPPTSTARAAASRAMSPIRSRHGAPASARRAGSWRRSGRRR